MIRQTSNPRRVDLEGHDRSQQLGLALAQICDPETLEKLIHMKTTLDSIGGQFYVAAFRNKYKTVADEEGQMLVPVDDPTEPGQYHTDGYVFHYEHIAKLNRQRAEPDAKRSETPDTLYAVEDVDEQADEAPEAEPA